MDEKETLCRKMSRAGDSVVGGQAGFYGGWETAFIVSFFTRSTASLCPLLIPIDRGGVNSYQKKRPVKKKREEKNKFAAFLATSYGRTEI